MADRYPQEFFVLATNKEGQPVLLGTESRKGFTELSAERHAQIIRSQLDEKAIVVRTTNIMEYLS